MERKLEWRGAPVPKGNRPIIVHRVTTSEAQEFLCLSPSPFGVQIHWFGGRSHECTALFSKCQGCQDSWPVKWKGYLHVAAPPSTSDVFLELTATAILLIESQLRERETWRGVRFRLRKTKGGPKGRYLAEVLERGIDPEKLPPEIDPLPTLRRLWRAKKGPSHNS